MLLNLQIKAQTKSSGMHLDEDDLSLASATNHGRRRINTGDQSDGPHPQKTQKSQQNKEIKRLEQNFVNEKSIGSGLSQD